MGGKIHSSDPLSDMSQKSPGVLNLAQATPTDNPHLTLHSQPWLS